MKYLNGYPPELLSKVRLLTEQGRLGDSLLSRYPDVHTIRTDKALYDYVDSIKQRSMRNSPLISKVAFDSKIQVIAHALGTHTTISRKQGKNLKAKHEIRIATVFRVVPDAFLRMIVVHELAHLKERDHNKSFYQLCQHIEPDYFQYEFDLRLYLTHLDKTGGLPLWNA
ncbi:DUF45 domain-containing protein [Paenalcaligenes niemegkensis]|uniref:M48 metallopeptidase family protein n=1 Tax=Paenalcaligenes niemegkensis TaxID=2895469 RepID=UPI001EE84B71|nr:YgjP-like metallopeptidase domain-containing protein [Paenalcaligenes niemegkensis]MCQ9616096.1 DUF45 domain-containing protein [Paenalcaligenes niemegkensis]